MAEGGEDATSDVVEVCEIEGVFEPRALLDGMVDELPGLFGLFHLEEEFGFSCECVEAHFFAGSVLFGEGKGEDGIEFLECVFVATELLVDGGAFVSAACDGESREDDARVCALCLLWGEGVVEGWSPSGVVGHSFAACQRKEQE